PRSSRAAPQEASPAVQTLRGQVVAPCFRRPRRHRLPASDAEKELKKKCGRKRAAPPPAKMVLLPHPHRETACFPPQGAFSLNMCPYPMTVTFAARKTFGSSVTSKDTICPSSSVRYPSALIAEK